MKQPIIISLAALLTAPMTFADAGMQAKDYTRTNTKTMLSAENVEISVEYNLVPNVYPTTFGTQYEVTPNIDMALENLLMTLEVDAAFLSEMETQATTPMNRSVQLQQTIDRAEAARMNRDLTSPLEVFEPSRIDYETRVRVTPPMFETSQQYFNAGTNGEPRISDYETFAAYRKAYDQYKKLRANRINNVVENSTRSIID